MFLSRFAPKISETEQQALAAGTVWIERPIFGMIRWMSYDGMRRKTHSDAYLKEIELMERTGIDPFRLQ